MLIGREIMMGDTSDLDAIRYQWKIERLEDPNISASDAHALCGLGLGEPMPTGQRRRLIR